MERGMEMSDNPRAHKPHLDYKGFEWLYDCSMIGPRNFSCRGGETWG